MWQKNNMRKFLAIMEIFKSLQNLIVEVQVGDIFDEDKYVEMCSVSFWMKMIWLINK